MDKSKQEMLEKLRTIKETAQIDIRTKHHGYEKCVIKNVIHYNKKVELINKETGEKETFDLCVALAEDPDTKEIWEMYYLDGEEVDFTELMREYESPNPIKDVIDAAEENKEKPEEEQEEELATEELEELDEEKPKDTNKTKEQKDEEHKDEKCKDNELTGRKPKNVMQTIDIDKAYAEEWKTVRKAFGLPVEVKQIAISEPLKNDLNALSSDLTIYMLDGNDNIIEDVDGKTIQDFFKIDSAVGKNAMNNENTQFQLDEENAKRTDGQVMRGFRAIENSDMYLSASKKKVGDYVEVSAGRKSRVGNDFVGVQLETRNVEIQTNLQKQKLVSGYKGIYNIDDIDKEVDDYEKHGYNTDKIPIKNADGKENILEISENAYIPGTEKTWKELSEEAGESITKLQKRFERELEKGKEPKEILEEIEYDYEMIEPTRDRI